MSEDKLIQKARRGEKEAFGVLYEKHIGPIYRFILVRLGNKADAEDVTHQVFLNAWQKMPGYRSEGHPFSSWLYRIAHNAVVDFYRTSRKHADLETVPEEIFADIPEFDQAVERIMQAKQAFKALKKLDHDHQAVLIMKFVNELSNKEIAAALGKSEGAVRVLQHRALKQLKSNINETPRYS